MKIRISALLISLILIFPTYSFFLSDKMFTFHDETQLANLHQYFKAIDFGQFPPRWAVDMHYEYGSPFLSFNYQLPYYLGYLPHLAGLSLTTIFKSLLTASLIIGATGMFFLGLFLTRSNFIAVTAAVLYSYTPFQAIDHFVRGALGESFALALFPWLFLASFALAKKVTPVRIIVLGLLFASLLLSHQPAALFALPLFLFIFVSSALFSHQPATAFAYLKSMALSVLLSAYYTIPVFFEKKFIAIDSPFNFRDQFPFIRQLLYSPWSYQGANPFSSDTISFQIGLVNLAALATAVVYFVFFLRREKDRFLKWFFAALLVATFLVIFLMNIRSTFIWETLPLIQLIQFPWRLLMFTTIFTAVIALLLTRRLKGKWLIILVFLLLPAVIGLNFRYFRPGKINDHSDFYYLRRFLPRSALLPGETISAEYLNHAEDYVPRPLDAIRPAALPSAKLTALDSSTQITVLDPNPLKFRAKVSSREEEQLTFHTFFYPGWTVTVDNYPTTVNKNEIGAITFAVTPGKHQIRAVFKDTPLRFSSNIISLGAFSFITSYLIYQLVSRHHATATARSRKPA